MTDNIKDEWWNNIQTYNIETIIQLGDKYPELIWSTIHNTSLFPSASTSPLLQRIEILDNSLENINALIWLLLNYNENDNIQSIISHILDKAEPSDLNDRLWGSKKNTVLHLVCLLGYEDICSTILQKGGSPDIENKDGYLPVHVTKKETIIQLLQSIKKNDNYSSPIMKTNSVRRNLKNKNSNNGETSTLEPNSSSVRRPNYSNPNRFQQLRQLAELSSHKSNAASNNIPTPSHTTIMNNGSTNISTMKHKEEAELQKHLEHRRKDIAFLAKRSAVKNNPFIKNSSDSLIKPAKRRQKSISSSSSITTKDQDINGSNKIEQPSPSIIKEAVEEKEKEKEKEDMNTIEEDEDEVEDEEDINTKPKRNSKVINSLQTKSYVTSSIFLQTEPSSPLPKKKISTASINSNNSNSKNTLSEKKADDSIAVKDKLEIDDDPLPVTVISSLSPPSSPSPLVSPSLDKTLSSESSISSSNSTQSSSIPTPTSVTIPRVKTQHQHHPHEELSSKIEISSIDIPLQHTKSFDIKNDDTNNELLSSSPITYNENNDNINENENGNEGYLFNEKKKQQSSPLPATSYNKKSTALLNKENNENCLDQRRISGSQKSNWTKEMETWSSFVDKKINIKETQPNVIRSSSVRENTNQQSNYFESNKYQYDDNDIKEISSYHSEYNQQQNKEENNSSSLNNESFGNISSTTTIKYIRRFPTYDQIPYTNSASKDSHKSNDTNDIKKENNNNNNSNQPINKFNNISVTSTLPNISLNQAKPHYPLVRSVSAFESTSSLTSFMNSSPFFSSNKNPSNPSSPSQQQHQTGIGKLYVRVNGINDVLLPIPAKDKVYVQCVINDGKYEYISGYELLAQQMVFGYECIIDCQPDMIITISLHIRADYLLKKPLTKLLTTVQRRKRKGSLSAFISNEDGSVGQTRFAVKDMLQSCYRRSVASQFHCFNAWYIPSSFLNSSSTASSPYPNLPFASSFIHKKKSTNSCSSSMTRTDSNNINNDDDDDSVLKVIGNFDVELLYLPVSDFTSVVPKNLRECDMAIKLQQWNETCLDTEFVPKKIHRPQPRVS
ncbi:hypothetical protein BJ944DRAFT_242311 [Cunninghamella echinulata]|nr:hypothetical protein BJ944DRAFT_242311 [Cunninghamella echinulata]